MCTETSKTNVSSQRQKHNTGTGGFSDFCKGPGSADSICSSKGGILMKVWKDMQQQETDNTGHQSQSSQLLSPKHTACAAQTCAVFTGKATNSHVNHQKSGR